MTLLSDDFQQFREHQRKLYRGAWTTVIAVSVGGGFALGVAWSYVAGVVWALGLPLISYDALKRWNRHRWLRRFPELAVEDFKWIPDSAGRAPSDPSDGMRSRRV